MKGWNCFPLWGLEMAENGHGLDNPIFGDATIVSRSYLRKYAPADPIAAALLSGGGLRAAIEGSVELAGPAPIDRLIDIPPSAFLAVRRSKADDATRYAESIRALLTGSAMLTSGVPKGFSLTPLPLQWAASPGRARLDEGEKLQIDYKITASNFIHLTPIRVSHRQLLDAWQSGSAIQGTWRLSKDDALSKVLVGDFGSLTGLRRRIRDAASTLARAMESTDNTLSTLFAVVALEILLKDGASDFAAMEEMAACIFEGPNGKPEISRLFGNRHKAAHEAKTPESETQHSLEISAAWVAIVHAAKVAEELSTVDEFLEHLRGRVLARRVGRQLRDAGKSDLADEVETAATFPRRGTAKK